MDVFDHNRRSWNQQSRSGQSRWCEPVDAATIAAARQGDWSVILTPTIPVPQHWFGDIRGIRILCLASGGGQQAPILAAAGARVTSFDAAEEQLALDTLVARRENLSLRIEQGDMADLSRFEDDSFDLIFHPVSNVFVADIEPVWRECHRVLATSGRLLAGFMNPTFYLFDHEAIEQGAPLAVKFTLPYTDLEQLPESRLQTRLRAGEALEFSHSLDAQIGGQLAAGFVLAGFYEDRWDDDATALNRHMPTSMATLARKI